jgi:hypothetical protein
MSKKRSNRAHAKTWRRLPLSISGNPLWPLEELHNLYEPRFVADPEFTPLAVGALTCETEDIPASVSDGVQIGPSRLRHHSMGIREFPIPRLVGGMPWRFRDQSGCPIVPEAEFVPLDISAFGRR